MSNGTTHLHTVGPYHVNWYSRNMLVIRNWDMTTIKFRTSQAKKINAYRLYLFWRLSRNTLNILSRLSSPSSIILPVVPFPKNFIRPENTKHCISLSMKGIVIYIVVDAIVKDRRPMYVTYLLQASTRWLWVCKIILPGRPEK